MNEDEIEIEVKNKKNEIELKSYRAKKYIKEFYGSQSKMTKELFDKNIISYKLITDIIKSTETIVRNIMGKKIKNPDKNIRHKLEIFFNKDFYEKELGKYNEKCKKCKKNCKQYYWVDILQCKK